MKRKIVLILGPHLIGSALHDLCDPEHVEVIESKKIEPNPIEEFATAMNELKHDKNHNNKHPFDKFINGGKKKKR